MGTSRSLIALIAAWRVGGGDEGASWVVETPRASPLTSIAVSPSYEVRSESCSPVDAGLLGMHVAGVQEGDWPANPVPTSSLRL